MVTVAITASKSYNIYIDRGLLDRCGKEVRATLPKVKKVMLVGDDTTMSLYGERTERSLVESGLTVARFTFPHGEESKDLATYGALLTAMAEAELTRSDCAVALGGGVVGDLTGFAAATYLRGIPVVQIPTTVLAAVDSSVGGKTAVDLPTGKNLVGAFHQPSLVLCDPTTFATLPQETFADGMAEVIKYGFIGDKDLLDRLAKTDLATLMNDAGETLEAVLAACVRDKGVFVQADEKDTGVRQKLNLGHTLGHGIEAASHFAISHGSAVAIGMHLVTRGAVRRGLCPPEALTLLEDLLRRYQLPKDCPYAADALYRAATHDKKRAGNTITLVLPVAVGESALCPMTMEEARTFVEDCMGE